MDDGFFRRESGRMLAALTRVFGVHNLALAEDVVQETLTNALEVWSHTGEVPEHAGALLMTSAKNRAIDVFRRERTARKFAPEIGRLAESEWTLRPVVEELFLPEALRDDELRMMFSCCAPALPEDVRVALTLNVLCGFTAHELASAFLIGEAAMEKRLSRGKKALAESKRLFELTAEDFAPRLSAVHRVLYLLFNEGYHGASTSDAVRKDLCREAIRLVRLLIDHKTAATTSTTTYALAALMHLNAARLDARIDAGGNLTPLADQDRGRWDRTLIAEGLRLMDLSASGTTLTEIHLEAAIASLHASAPSMAATPWAEIVELYDRLLTMNGSPVVALSRTIAIAEATGPESALTALDEIADVQRLKAYPFYEATRGELFLRAGRKAEAARHFEAARKLARNDSERRFLDSGSRPARRLRGMSYPRGPRTPVLWQSFWFVLYPKNYTKRVRAKYGDAFGFRTLLGKGLAVFEPSLAREVFAAPPDTFETLPAVQALFGQHAVIATNGAEHRRQRKLLNPPFHGPRIKAMLGTMQRVIERQLEPLAHAAKTGAVVKMTDITQAITLDVILETVFGFEMDDAMLDRGREVLLEIVHGFNPSIITTTKLQSSFFPPWRRFARTRAAFDEWVNSVMTMRRTKGAVGDDLLGLFLSTRYDDGSPMSDAEIRDHLITLLLAGHETSAIAIAWAAYWLAKEPRVLAKLRDEIADLETPEQLVKNAYLNAVGSESLRIEPIVTDVVRYCQKPLKLRDWTVPAGEHIAVMLGSILNDERVYPEPNTFKPERFLERTFHAGEFLPFGGGTRRCLGAAFAEAELALSIAKIASSFDLELADSKPEHSVRRNITMGPARGVRVKVRSRRAKKSVRDEPTHQVVE